MGSSFFSPSLDISHGRCCWRLWKPNHVPMAQLRLGRKGPLVWSYLQLAVSGAATAYVSSFSAYCVFRFLMGMTFSGIILNSLSLGESSQGGAWRGGVLTEQGEVAPSLGVFPVSSCWDSHPVTWTQSLPGVLGRPGLSAAAPPAASCGPGLPFTRL